MKKETKKEINGQLSIDLFLSETKDLFPQACQISRERQHITAGMLVNRLRISANDALALIDRMKKDGVVNEKGDWQPPKKTLKKPPATN